MILITEDWRLVVLPSWPASLGLARELGGEYEAEKAHENRHKRERENFKSRLSRGEHEPKHEQKDGCVEDLEHVEDPEPVERKSRSAKASALAGPI